MTVGAVARRLAETEKAKQQAVDYAFIAGILHDVGKLMLASKLPEEYEKVLNRVTAGETGLSEAERDILGASHAGIGAYLLGLWGLSDPIIEAIAFHHTPRESTTKDSIILLTAHVADYLVNKLCPYNIAEMLPQLDQDYLAEAGLEEHLPLWENICQETIQEHKDHHGKNPFS